MWKRYKLDEKEYLIRRKVNEGLHKLYLTDLTFLWCEEISENCLLQRCKEMNKLLEAKDDVLLRLVWSLVEGKVDDVCTTSTDSGNDKQLNLQCSLDGVKFRIKFVLHLLGNKEFFSEVSCLLLTTISELEKRQSLLVGIIKKKDLEIAEYKLEGATISRKAVETQVFDPDDFLRECAESLGTTKGLVQTNPSHTFTPRVQQLLSDIANATVVIPRENQDNSKAVDRNNYKKVGPIKLKSPVKSKKAKLYDDEEDMVNQAGARSQEETEKEVEDENKVVGNFEENKQPKHKPLKGKARPKVNKALSNL